eukprot:2505537-Pyramimonas_sp.AAC.1
MIILILLLVLLPPFSSPSSACLLRYSSSSSSSFSLPQPPPMYLGMPVGIIRRRRAGKGQQGNIGWGKMFLTAWIGATPQPSPKSDGG